jgi:hypothetical protein
MIDLIEFKAEHAEILCPKAVDSAMHDCDWRKWAEINESGGLGYTGIYKDKMIFAAGVRHVRDGVGDMWAVITSDCRQCLKDVIWAQRTMLAIVASEMGIWRLRSDSRIGFPESQRLLRAMGFMNMRTMLNGKYYYFKRLICPGQD